jgi:hypothetical protein
MSQSIDVQELAIVLVAPNHRPTMLNLEFLQCGNIIPDDWNVIRPPVNNPQAAQIVFQNGVNLSAQGSQISFVEPIATKTPQEILIPQIARKYVEVLPHAGYQAIGINLRGFVSFSAQDADASRQFLTQELLAPGGWQNYGQQPIRAGINLAYTLEGRQLYVSINEVTLQRESDVQAIPGVMFSGNFEYRFEESSEGNGQGDRLEQVLKALDHWQDDFTAYTDLINRHFLPNIKTQETWDSLKLETEASEPELVPIGA